MKKLLSLALAAPAFAQEEDSRDIYTNGIFAFNIADHVGWGYNIVNTGSGIYKTSDEFVNYNNFTLSSNYCKNTWGVKIGLCLPRRRRAAISRRRG